MKRKSPDKIRTESIRVSVTSPELEELQAAASHVGMAVSVFIRVKALESARKPENRAA
jgi:hypothetical protein